MAINGLSPYPGEWTRTEAWHLLRRATFGPSPQMVNDSVETGLQATLDQLFSTIVSPDPPVKFIPDGDGSSSSNTLFDPDVSFGETWVNAPPFPDSQIITTNMERNRILRSRRKSLDGWSFLLMHAGEVSIREKMVIFWHNHFVASEFTIAQRAYNYISVIREHALGNFRYLTKMMAIDSAMLLFLNGAQSTKEAPNENFPREMLELFTVGKGELAGPGDYTTFTEDDVTEMSKVLTGWRVSTSAQANQDGSTLVPFFDEDLHSPGDKQLSYRFNNAIISYAGETEYQDLIDIVFLNPACSYHIARELYRWFVYYDITPDIEAHIIGPMAQMIRDNDYEIAPALRALLGSEHFFMHSGCMVKSPVDLMLSLSQGLGVAVPADLQESYEYGVMLHKLSEELGMSIFNHVHVGGWAAYYQAPQYYRFWLNNLTFPERNAIATTFVTGGQLVTSSENFNIQDLIPVLDLAASTSNPLDPDELVYSLAELAFPAPVSPEQKDYLKSALIPEQIDSEWIDDYQNYLDNPDSTNARNRVRNRLRALFSAMLQMPEFQLM